MKTLLRLLLCLLAVPLFAATAVEHAAAGRAAMERGQIAAAAAAYEKAIAADPKNADYHYQYGSAVGRQALGLNPFKGASFARKAKTALERAVQLDPRHYHARLALIIFYMQAPGFLGGGEEKAFAQAAEMKKLDSFMGRRAMTRIYRLQEKPELARKEMVEAVREQPNNPDAHYFLGNNYYADKMYPQARHEYEYALKLDPNHMGSTFRLGMLASETNSDHARGEASLKKYLTHKPGEDEPSIASTWYYLGKLYEVQGRKADAKASYLNALKLVPDDTNIKDALKRVS